MRHQSSAKIYLADQYIAEQSVGTRSVTVFNDQANPFTNLWSVKDEVIAPGCYIEYYLYTGAMLLPVVGSLLVYLDGRETEIACGELLLVNQVTHIRVMNHYDDALVNYAIMIFTQSFVPELSVSKCSFNLNGAGNEMQDIISNDLFKMAIGKFEMRRDTTYFTGNSGKYCFCWVLQGSFEIEGRLLHARDALAVWNTSELDIESLGKESILLLIEQERTNNNLHNKNI